MDGLTRPELTLTRSKYLPLTRVLFGLTQRDFFGLTGKFFEKFSILRGNFPNLNQRQLTRPYQGQNFLTGIHHYDQPFTLSFEN